MVTTHHHGRARRLATFLSALMMGLISAPYVSADESCTQLLKNRCEACHYLTRVCQKVDRERKKRHWFGGPEGTWQRTIKNMIKQGAKLNDEEEKILVACLSNPGPELLSLCKLDK